MNKVIDIVKKIFTSKQTVPKDYREELNRKINILTKYQEVYATEVGQEVINDILTLCGYGQINVGRDPNETYFKLGEQNIGIEIVQRITADISALVRDGEQTIEEEE